MADPTDARTAGADPDEVNALRVSAVAMEMRAWLRARPESPAVQASAMAYELAALLARQADTPSQACDLVDWWTTVMKMQIRDFGVGVEHP